MNGLLPDTDLLALGLAWALGFLKASQGILKYSKTWNIVVLILRNTSYETCIH